MSFWAKTPHRPRRCPLFDLSQRPAEGRNFLGDGVGDGPSSPFSTSIHTRAKGRSRHAGGRERERVKTSPFSTFQKPQTTCAVRNTPKFQRIKSEYINIHRTTRKYSEMLRNTQKPTPTSHIWQKPTIPMHTYIFSTFQKPQTTGDVRNTPEFQRT